MGSLEQVLLVMLRLGQVQVNDVTLRQDSSVIAERVANVAIEHCGGSTGQDCDSLSICSAQHSNA